MDEQSSSGTLQSFLRSRWAGPGLNLIVLALIIIGLFLPPVSLGKVFTSDRSTDERVWSAADPDGTELTILPVGLRDNASLTVELTSVPRVDFLAGTADKAYQPLVQALPSHLIMKSPFYKIGVQGDTPQAATLRIPIPNDAEPLNTLDVYAWRDGDWHWLPRRIRADKDDILLQLDSVPDAVAVMQTQQTELLLSAPLPTDQSLSQEQIYALTEIHPDGGVVEEDGSIQTKPPPSLPADPGVRIMPTVRNWADTGKVWEGRIDHIIQDETLRQAHIAALSQFVAQGGYDGVDIDYRGLAPESRTAFSQFVAELAQKLHQQDKLIGLRVSLPVAITPEQWDTGPYDWPTLSGVIDILRAPMLIDPRAYRPDGQAQDFLDWAVSEADRYKLQLIFQPLAVEQAGSDLLIHSYVEALALLTQLDTAGAPNIALSGDEVPLKLSVLSRSSSLLYDEALHTWWFTYLDESLHQRTVLLNNAEGLISRAEWAASYHLRGITIEGLTEPDTDPNLWPATHALSGGTEPPVAERFSLQWQTTGPSSPDAVVKSLTAENAAFAWPAPSIGGTYGIAAVVAQDDQTIVTGEPLSVRVVTSIAMLTPTPTPTPEGAAATSTPTPTPTSVPPTATPTPTSTPTQVPPTATPTPVPTATRVPATATPTFTPAPTPTPTMPPGPTLVEPEPGSSFGKEVRLKWTWDRRLADSEKFAVRWEPIGAPNPGDWWVSEGGILSGGGAIYPVEGGYRFEVNFGLGPYPGGEALWSVAVFSDMVDEKRQVSQWSEQRQIFKGPRP